MILEIEKIKAKILATDYDNYFVYYSCQEIDSKSYSKSVDGVSKEVFFYNFFKFFRFGMDRIENQKDARRIS